MGGARPGQRGHPDLVFPLLSSKETPGPYPDSGPGSTPLEVTVPRIAIDVIGCVVIASGVIGASVQFARLGSRRAARIPQVISARSGVRVRWALLTAALGIWLLIGGWAAVSVPLAIIAWELAVQVTAQVKRVHT